MSEKKAVKKIDSLTKKSESSEHKDSRNIALEESTGED